MTLISSGQLLTAFSLGGHRMVALRSNSSYNNLGAGSSAGKHAGPPKSPTLFCWCPCTMRFSRLHPPNEGS